MPATQRACHSFYTIRDACPADAEALAALHVAVWQQAYRGILPDAYLDGLTPAQRLPLWQSILAEEASGHLTLVLEAGDGSLGGFLSAGPPRDLPRGGRTLYRAEIYAINILPALQGRGQGRRLLLHAADWLGERGLMPFFLWVLADNARARSFYDMLGGQLAARRSVAIGGKRLTELAYHYREPAEIARRAFSATGRRG